MTGSYLMVDPAGRFFDNVNGRHTYSRPIIEVGVTEALKDIRFDLGKFYEREGVYDWG
jgi:radical S-adenosyl methionine domain-containing protein 2